MNRGTVFYIISRRRFRRKRKKSDVGSYKVVTLCGSTRFKDAFIATQKRLTLDGNIMENIEAQREILDLPEYAFPTALLVFGYPTGQQKERSKPQRVDMRSIEQETLSHGPSSMA